MESITPQEAVDQYLQSRHDVTRSTKENHRYRLNYFIQWTEEQGIEQMNELTGMDCERFKNWRIENHDLNLVTLQYHIGMFRVFLRWCESVNAVNAGIADNILIPKVSDSEKARDIHLTHERAQQIVDYLVPLTQRDFSGRVTLPLEPTPWDPLGRGIEPALIVENRQQAVGFLLFAP